MTQSVATVSSDFKSHKKIAHKYVQTVASRYGTIILTSQRRIKKLKKILEKIQNLKNQK